MGDYTQVPNPPADPVATPSAQPDFPVLDPNRPVSTIPADSTQTPTPVQPSPADPVQPVSEPPLQGDQVFEATASADVIPPADSEATASGSIDSSPPVPQSPQPPQVPQQSDVQAPAASPVLTEPQSPPVSIPVDPPKESDIQEPAPSNQPSQVQPEAPKDMPVVQVENTPPQSAGIKPEPPQGTKNIPSADIKIPETPKSSFGDLMGKPSDLSVEPAIHIDPIEAPTTPPVTPTSPPIVTPPPQPTEENQQAALALRRQHAIQARKQKRDENLDQILELAQKKGTVKNLDVRDFLHISQTTATDYLRTLVNSGKLKKEGKAKATTYSL